MRNVLAGLLLMFTAPAFADWVPPANPDPRAILDEARADARDGRYADALAKHLWFHNEALKHSRALYGVRLSFALGGWVDLGAQYPPARAALKQVRDEAIEALRTGSDYYEAFHDVASINTELKAEAETVALFRWLDREAPDRARAVYRIAEPILVRAKAYKLCGKYLDPQNAYLRYVRHFRFGLDYAKDSRFGGRAERFAYAHFVNSVATLVALLVLNERAQEANEVAEMALLEWDDKGFAAELETALQGSVPRPWR